MTQKTKTTLYLILSIVGLSMAIITGLFLGDILTDTQQSAITGIGAGLFGYGLVKFNLCRWEKENPEEMHRQEIEANDERTVAIRHRAQALSGNIFQWLVMALAWVLIFADAPLWMILTCAGIFLAKSILDLCLMAYYEKRM